MASTRVEADDDILMCPSDHFINDDRHTLIQSPKQCQLLKRFNCWWEQTQLFPVWHVVES